MSLSLSSSLSISLCSLIICFFYFLSPHIFPLYLLFFSLLCLLFRLSLSLSLSLNFSFFFMYLFPFTSFLCLFSLSVAHSFSFPLMSLSLFGSLPYMSLPSFLFNAHARMQATTPEVRKWDDEKTKTKMTFMRKTLTTFISLVVVWHSDLQLAFLLSSQHYNFRAKSTLCVFSLSLSWHHHHRNHQMLKSFHI